ncbi:Bromodomain adjacent to zinc finger domain protein 1A, partial [Pseudolycoriella hygida]
AFSQFRSRTFKSKMPLFKRKPFERLPPPDGLKDSEEIYYLELSKEAFRSYEDYFERMMLLNSTVWSCALTSKPNLTFSEALDSEKKARKILRDMTTELKAPIIIIAGATKCSTITEMVDEVFNYISLRIFKEEICFALDTNAEGQKVQREVQVLAVIGSKTTADPGQIKYRVKRVDTNRPHPPFVVTSDEIHRKRGALPKDKLKLFLKQCVRASETGQLEIKDDIYKKYVTDAGISGYADIFPGPPPKFEVSKSLALKIERVSK